MTLIKEFADYLALLASMKLPLPWEVSISEYRSMTLPNPKFIGEPESIHHLEHRIISGPTGYLPIRIYRPSSEPNLPAMVYFHGGGWVIGNMDGFEPTVRSLANKGNFVVIQVQYQKAPELPFPTPFDDCYATLEWVVSNADLLGIDPKAIGVGGDSAGGNLAAAVALKARDSKLVNLAFQMLVYPCTGNDGNLPSAINNAEGFGLTSRVMRWYENQYAQVDELKEHPYAFPAKAKSFSDLAPAVVITAQYDTLADDGRIYAEKLEQSGVPVYFKEYPGAIHGFNALAGVAPKFVHEVQVNLAQEINRILGRS
jgi:acetyl esterase